MNPDEITRDMPECEQHNLSPGDVGYKPKYLVQEMMGETYATYFEDEAQSQAREEKAQDHALDNKF